MKQIFLCMLVTLLSLGLSCNPDDCGDGPKTEAKPFFRLTNVNVDITKITDTVEISGVKTLIIETITPQDTIAYNEFALRIAGQPEFYAFHSLPFFSCQPSVACSPLPIVEAKSKEKPDSILIYSDSSFDAAHPAGSSLNDLFKSVDTLSKPSNIARLYEANVQQTYKLALVAKPQPKQIRFYIYFRQNNGVIFLTSTPTVLFR